MPRSRTKHENIITGERIPKKFAFKAERALPTGKVHAHTYDARTLSNWWKTGQRTLPHLGNTPATPAEQKRVAAILAAQRPGKMERFLYKPSTRTRSNSGGSSVNWSAPGPRTPSNLVHHPSAPINQLQAAKRATDSMLRKLYSRIHIHAPFSINQNVGNRIRINGVFDHEGPEVYLEVSLIDSYGKLSTAVRLLVEVENSKAYLFLFKGEKGESTFKALHVMITRQIISTLRKLDPAMSFVRHDSNSSLALKQFNSQMMAARVLHRSASVY